MIHSKTISSRNCPEFAEGVVFDPTPGLPGWKRVLDVGLVVLTSPAWLPLMLVISAVIKMASPGPALFRQVRIGRWGRPFTCYKFRTMHARADTRVHQGHLLRLMDSNLPMRKLDSSGDLRLIPCGLLLRTLGSG